MSHQTLVTNVPHSNKYHPRQSSNQQVIPPPPPPPPNVGIRFPCDVIQRSRQFILLIRECITSFTSACIIPDEKRSSLRSGLLQLILPLHAVNAATARTDPAPGFQAITRDHSFIEFNISFDLGQSKNINKNPIAEKAVQELEKEILQQDPSGDPISSVSLACAVSRLNTRTVAYPLMKCGFSANSSRISNYTLLMITLLQVSIANVSIVTKSNKTNHCFNPFNLVT